ncbi:glycosyltransferase [Desulfogranum marinum]|uniref:glycosyltransferase n=1 Tax=Desulfogranum marinum TaxID=453220 RepID=UPI001966A16A|nr:glycosyltransferase [Desulfogranum marinum]MBM9514558.1 glycosyltransferase [Desulfogranum marinum]
MIDFSIIIPAKNEETNIAHCLDSINAVKFDHNRFEVLVVDNGSIDRTVDVANEKNAKVFVQPDLTISGLRNFGANKSIGKVLVFLDADCTVRQNWLDAAEGYLGDSNLACFGSPPVVPDDATWVQKTWFSIRKKKSPVEDVEWLESMNMFVPRETFLAVNGFNERLVTCEDYDLSIRLQKHGRIIADQRIIAVHHGEARDLANFFRKERWRATSNRERLVGIEFNLREVPSLVLPILYCLLALVFVVYLFLFGLFDGSRINSTWVFLLLLWQVPLLVLSFWKIRQQFCLFTGLQLFVLLNVYFYARGLACMKKC